MNRTLAAFLNGAVVGLVIVLLAAHKGYTVFNWQVWAAVFALTFTNVVYRLAVLKNSYRILASMLNGGVIGFTTTTISGYNNTAWQLWVGILATIIMNVIYAHSKN